MMESTQIYSGVSNWFKCLQDEGENLKIHASLYDNNDQKIQDFEFEHHEIDGLGVVQHVLKKRKIALPIQKTSLNLINQNFIQKILGSILYFLTAYYKASPWEYQTTNTNNHSFKTFRIMCDKKKKLIKEAAKKHNCNQFTFFLGKLDLTIRKYIKGHKTCWTIPLNMDDRHKIKTGNHIGFLFYRYNSKKSFQYNFNQIRKKVFLGIVWGPVYTMYFLKLLGEKITSKMIRFLPCIQFNTGAFSYMKNLGFNDEYMVGYTPVTKTQPFSVIIGEFESSIVLCFHAHSLICKNQDYIEGIADTYIENIFEIKGNNL
jgi:hypothetical protein